MESFSWWSEYEFLGGDPSEASVPYEGMHLEPTAGMVIPELWDDEVQGIAFDPDYMYLVTTDGLWAVRRHAGATPKNLPPGQMRNWDDKGLQCVGRRHLRKEHGHLDRTPGPKHLSAPSLYRSTLLVPAEGDPRPDGQQWIWVFDTSTLGYLGRIGLDASVSMLANEIAWCSADEASDLLYASRFHDPGSVPVFRLPAWDGFDRPPYEGPAVDVEFTFPTLSATYLGAITITDFDGSPPGLSGVQGGVVTPDGHLYIDFMDAKGDTAWGVLGLDILTGRAVRYLSLGSAHEFASGQVLQGLAVSDNRLRVLIWDWDVGDNEYSVFNFGLKQATDRW
jgi:hypothetical protein